MSTSIEDQPFAAAATGTAVNAPFSWWGLVSTLIIFLLILGVALWMIRRLNRSALRGMSSPWARVLDRQLLGGQQVLYLVEVAGRLQVLAGSDHYLTKLQEIEDPDLVAEILDEIAHRPTERVEGVLSRLRRWDRPKKRKAFAKELANYLEEVDR
ncbi:MAG: flagellar biosynthetic protein FliO [Desulfitobacteriaceae bacterium]|nr:flagellar biosynthetic protein FliO [Desulfitobacteriaceae bacterium]MDI6878873.1 flagellar biosynthetic protein FliO [Desulfitobacteriaceae bacterium]MDI6914506.1 flagellar biosynthetic protein FliO [Desulfitobacteriaceae bacterium]